MSNSKVIAASLLIPITILVLTLFQYPIAQADTPKLGSGAQAIWKPVNQFSDVKVGNKYYIAIDYLRTHGIIEGYANSTFRPNQNISRAEALKIFLLTSKVILDSGEIINKGNILRQTKESPFTDVSTDLWFASYLAIAKDKKIISGYEDGSFKPNDPINLAESLKMYFEAVNSVNNGQINFEESINENFIDVAPDTWFSKYVNYAGLHQIINIYSDNTVNPNQVMSRGYLAEIIYRTMQNKEGLEFGKATYYFGIPGKDNDSYDQELMTTAHKTLPKGTILKVTNLTNGKSVKVKVTDRGPYGPGRVLDLSKKAFSKIALPSEGIVNIEFQQVSPEI